MAVVLAASIIFTATIEGQSIEMPLIAIEEEHGFDRVPDVAYYKNADWSSLIGVSEGISLDKALEFAEGNPEVRFFFYTKGYQMVLEQENGGYRLFYHGDAAFFSKDPWWGSAPGLADGYVRIEN